MSGGQNSQVPHRPSEADAGAIAKLLRGYYLVPFRALGVGVRIFRNNRAWIAERLAHRGAAVAIQGFFVLTVVVWLVIRFFAT
ncbi:MAG: hypothetical protein V3S29_06790 [bacterium]